MKFYKYVNGFNYWGKIRDNKLNAIYINKLNSILFYKNSKLHNAKNAAYIGIDGYKEFYLNEILYDSKKDFNKKSWRRFVKLQTFL